MISNPVTQSVPKVSVVMPVYNGERYLRQAVDSIFGQTLMELELMVVDDGSSDLTPNVLRQLGEADPRMLVLRLAHQGLTKALNAGIRVARAEFVARMDADDICLSVRLDRQLQFLVANPEIVAVGTQVIDIDDAGLPIADSRSLPLDHEVIDKWNLNGGGGINHPSSMFRRSALEGVGGYREQFSTAQDLDMFLRLAEVGRLANLSEPLLFYRRHLQMAGVSRKEEQRAMAVQACRDAHERRGMEFSPDAMPTVLFPSAADQRRYWGLAALGNGYFATSWRHAKALIRDQPGSWQGWDLLLCHIMRRYLFQRRVR